MGTLSSPDWGTLTKPNSASLSYPRLGGISENISEDLIPSITAPSIGDTDGNRLVLDHENVWRSCKAEELRSYGYRRVENLLSYSEDFSNAAWSKQEVSIAPNAATAPDGTVSADKLIPSAVSSTHQIYKLAVVPAARISVLSIYAKADGYSTFFLLDQGGNHGGSFDLDAGTATNAGSGSAAIASVGGGWYRCTVATTASGFRLYCPSSASNVAGDGTSGILIWGAQFEDSTGRTDTTTPSEYISTNALSSPYHGANCDGVKYFTTENGNSVTDNVVTEGTGAAISSSTLKGLFCEGAATELSGYSADLGNANWANNATVAQNAVGLSGSPNEAFTLTDNSNSVAQDIRRSTAITSGSGTYYVVARVKYNASPSVYPRIYVELSGGTTTNQSIVFDPSDGSFVEPHTAGATLTPVRVGDYWFVVQSITDNASGNNAALMIIDPANNADGTVTEDVTAQGSTVFASCELYKDTWSYSPILTTGGTTKTRSADVEATIDGSAWPDGDVSVEFELTPFFDTGIAAGIIAPEPAVDCFFFNPSGRDVRLSDGSVAIQKSNAWSTAGDTIKVKFRANASTGKMNFSVDGAAATEANYDGSFNPSGDIILFRSLTLGAAMKNLRIYSEDLGEGWLAS